MADPLEFARKLATAGGNNLHNVEHYARNHARDLQHGEQAAVNAEIASINVQIQLNICHARDARGERNRTRQRIPSRGGRRPMSWWEIALTAIMIIGLLAALVVEQFGAATVLVNTGAFNVVSIEQGLLLTATAIAVGFALKLAYGILAPSVQRVSFELGCVALIALFALWSFNFANEAGIAARQRDGFDDAKARTENLSDGSNPVPTAKSSTPDSQPASPAWLLFWSLVSMMVLTSAIGGIGIEHHLGRFETWMDNPDYGRAVDNVNHHENEVASLIKARGALEAKLAHFIDAENAAAEKARTAYMAARIAIHKPQNASL